MFRVSFLQIWAHHDTSFLLATADILSMFIASSQKAEHTDYFLNWICRKTELSEIHQYGKQYRRAKSPEVFFTACTTHGGGQKYIRDT